jgi:hypothetical protein
MLFRRSGRALTRNTNGHRPGSSNQAVVSLGGTAQAGTPKGADGSNDAVSRNYSAVAPTKPFLGVSFAQLRAQG